MYIIGIAALEENAIHSPENNGKFQNLDPKSLTFFDVLRHFKAHLGKNWVPES